MSSNRTLPLQSFESIPRKSWIRVGVAFVVLGAVAWCVAPTIAPDDWWVHGVWCGCGLAVAVPTLVRVFRINFACVLTDHRFVFLGVFSLYFLLGAGFLAWGEPFDIKRLLDFYPIGAGDALRADAVNGIGFGVAVLMASLARGRWIASRTADIAEATSRLSPTLLVGTFLLIGATASYYLLPFELGFSDSPPTIVRMLALLSLVGIFLSSAHRGSGERVLRVFGIVLAVSLSSVRLLGFMKEPVLLPIAALTAGLSLRFGSRRVLPFGLAILVLGYLTLGDVVAAARDGANGQLLTLSQRWSVLQDAWAGTRNLEAEERYSYWGRLCSLPTQVAGMDLWEAGEGGSGMSLVLWVAVPRLVAPSKPDMTAVGTELFSKITGDDGSYDKEGIFGSGYYAGGWLGVVIASALCGWVLSQTSSVAQVVYRHRAQLLLPLSLQGLFIAFRIDGDFVPDYLGAYMFVLYPILAGSLAVFMLRPAAVRSTEQWRQ